MNKFFLLTNFLLFNSIITVYFRIIEEQNKTESNEKKGIFCKIDDSFLCKHTAIFFLILFIIILLVVVGSCLFIKYCYERHPFLRGWERMVAQRLSNQRKKKKKEEELLERKKKYYLLNIEIKEYYKKYMKKNKNNLAIKKWEKHNYIRFISLENYLKIIENVTDEATLRSIMIKLGQGSINQDEALILGGIV